MSTTTAPSTPRLSCSLDAINTTGILRKTYDPVAMEELKASIKDNIAKSLPPLIHPIVVRPDMRLLSGSRRLRAHRELGLKEIDYIIYGVMEDDEAVRVEVDANKQEKFTWQEKVLGIDKYHQHYSLNAALKGEHWGFRETGALLRVAKSPVHKACFIAEYLHANDQEVWAAESIDEAYKILLKREEERLSAMLVKMSVTAKTPQAKVTPAVKKDVKDDEFFAATDGKVLPSFTPGISSPVIILDEAPGQQAPSVIPLSSILRREPNHNTLSVMSSLGADAVDHIICDPPYGIDVAMMQQDANGIQNIDDVAKEHDVEQNLALLDLFLKQAFVTIRPKGFLVAWCDPVHWWKLCVIAEAAGFTIQRWPLVWHKTSSCINSAAQYNFTKNIEFALVARKQGAVLAAPQKSCVWTGGSDTETRLYGHPFAKPAGLWEWVANATTLRGQSILDPFAGSCSSGVPLIKLGYKWQGIECSDKWYNIGMVNLQNLYKSFDPNCSFE